ncbi:MAG: hypothetical protein QOE34_1160, partial [Verrucomicrobiota bacterium]
ISAISEVVQLLNYAFAYLEITLRDEDRRSNLTKGQLRQWPGFQRDHSGNRFSYGLAILVLEAIETEKWVTSDVNSKVREVEILLVHIGDEEAPDGTRLHEELVYSNDLLINLVRYSPYCAFQMMKAGLDILSLMRVGVNLRNTDWGKPNSCLFQDFLGSPAIGQVAMINEIKRIGYLDEASLLVSLLQFASLGGTFVTELLTKTFNLMQGKTAKEPANAEIENLKNEVVRSLREGNYRYRDQQWSICLDGARLRLRPFAFCGIYKIAGLTSDEVTSVRLHVEQRNTFFARPAFKALEDLLNSKPTAADLDTLLEATEELQATTSL